MTINAISNRNAGQSLLASLAVFSLQVAQVVQQVIVVLQHSMTVTSAHVDSVEVHGATHVLGDLPVHGVVVSHSRLLLLLDLLSLSREQLLVVTRLLLGGHHVRIRLQKHDR